MNPFERIIYWLIVGSRGGKTRAEIILAISKSPMNQNRLSEALNLDYKTVQHHLRILSENGIIEGVGANYGKVFMLSERAEELSEKIIRLAISKIGKIKGKE